MARRKKLAPLTPEQTEAIHMLAADLTGQAVAYAHKLNAWHQGAIKKRPDPGDLDPEVARVTEDWIDAIGVKAEEVVMEPYDQEVSDAA